MSAAAREPKAATPRFVTGAPSPERTARARSRYAVDPTVPNPAVRADAMGSTVLAYLITGPVLFGGIGWLVDRWLGITAFVAVGIVAGMALSLYTIWLRYGTSQAPASGPPTGTAQAAEPHNEEIP